MQANKNKCKKKLFSFGKKKKKYILHKLNKFKHTQKNRIVVLTILFNFLH